MTTIALEILCLLLAYKVYVNQNKAQQFYREFDRLNRIITELEAELWQNRIDLQTQLNLAKMEHEKTKAELEDKAQIWENQYNAIKNESNRN